VNMDGNIWKKHKNRRKALIGSNKEIITRK
jgi:hypothetical protein